MQAQGYRDGQTALQQYVSVIKDAIMEFEELHSTVVTPIFDQTLLDYNVSLPPNSIVHFSTSLEASRAQLLGFRSIYSAEWDLSKMHPNSAYHYFYQDTWWEMNKINLRAAGKWLGGGILAGQCYVRSCFQQLFLRGTTIAAVLWRGNNAGWVSELDQAVYADMFGCMLGRAGIGFGPLEVGEPCPGTLGGRMAQ